MVELTMAEAAALTGARLAAGDPGAVFAGAALDSRRVRGGELFFAFSGEATDGHRFVGPALAAGAAAAVVSEAYLRQRPEALERWQRRAPGAAVLAVEPAEQGPGESDNTAVLDALHALTREVRGRVPEHLAGITGSAGKTTTKEILSALLAARYSVAKSPGNYNNLLGFPLALLEVEEGTTWMVAEMGMSEPGELGRLSRLARPEVALFTNVRAAHLEFFGSLDAIATAKAELLEGLPEDGTVVANADDPRLLAMARREAAAGRQVVLYGRGEGAEAAGATVLARGLRPAADGEVGTLFRLQVQSGDEIREVEIHLPLHGAYNVDNFLAAAAAAWHLGLSLEEIAAAARGLSGVAGRGEVASAGRGESAVTWIDDAYNANPDATERALESAAVLAESRGASRRWAVLGDMLELGPEGPELHRGVGLAAARLGFAPLLAVGEMAEDLLEGARAGGLPAAAGRGFAAASEAAAAASEELRPGDLVLIKASRGVRLDEVSRAVAEAADHLAGETGEGV